MITDSRLTLIKRTSGGTNPKGVYLCSCGNTKELFIAAVKRGNTKSCGCYAIESRFKHGLYKHPLYSTWVSMIQRCYNPKHQAFKYYGGIGVRVAPEWVENFKSFYDWAIKTGWVNGLQLDKDIIALELGVSPKLYSPERCQFVTAKINGTVRKNSFFITYKNKTQTIQQWAEELGIGHNKLRNRIRTYKWCVEDAFNTK